MLKITGDIIHLLGYYPEPPSTERPRPVFKPIYTYPKPTSTFHQSPSHPQWDENEHETNHINTPPSYNPLIANPDDHYGLVDEGGYGQTESDSSFSHHSFNDYKPSNSFSEADEDYRPFQGTHFSIYNISHSVAPNVSI